MANRSPRSYEHIVRAVFDQPWAILPSVHRHMVEIVSERLRAGRLDQAEIDARLAGVQAAPAGTTQAATGGAIAVLPLYGMITQRAGMMEEMSGGTSCETFVAQLQQLAADPNVVAIVIDVDSPGGGVYGVPEAAKAIYDARAAKPIVAVSNSLNASAAYWLSSQAHEVVASPSSETGSIGVYTAHRDESAKNAADGIQYTLISAGKYKVEGNPFEPLTDEAATAMQSRVQGVYDAFVADVARGRGVSVEAVISGYGQGRVVGAKQAVAINLADRVDTMEGTLKRLSVPLNRAAIMRGERMAEPVVADAAMTEVNALDVLAERLMVRLEPRITALVNQETAARSGEAAEAEDEAPWLGIDVDRLAAALGEQMKEAR